MLASASVCARVSIYCFNPCSGLCFGLGFGLRSSRFVPSLFPPCSQLVLTLFTPMFPPSSPNDTLFPSCTHPCFLLVPTLFPLALFLPWSHQTGHIFYCLSWLQSPLAHIKNSLASVPRVLVQVGHPSRHHCGFLGIGPSCVSPDCWLLAPSRARGFLGISRAGPHWLRRRFVTNS